MMGPADKPRDDGGEIARDDGGEIARDDGREITGRKVTQNDEGILIAPGEIRTPDHLVRSQILYPTELQALLDLSF